MYITRRTTVSFSDGTCYTDNSQSSLASKNHYLYTENESEKKKKSVYNNYFSLTMKEFETFLTTDTYMHKCVPTL